MKEKHIRNHTKKESVTGNEPLILSIEDLEIFTHFNMQHHEVITEWFDIFIQQSHAIRNPDKLSLDLRLWGWSHTLNLPKCYLQFKLIFFTIVVVILNPHSYLMHVAGDPFYQ